LLRTQGGDFQSFYREAKALSGLAKIKRHRNL